MPYRSDHSRSGLRPRSDLVPQLVHEVAGHPALAFSIELAQLGLDRRIVDQDKPDVLLGVAARGAKGGIEYARLNLDRNRIGRTRRIARVV
jgi:hypothetical protein